ncbi:MAG: acetolactate synthase large subunit, partial [Clostridia bacterium]|nr:acetolactate synthase large subunit [Clostridia bacterium]
GDGSFGMNLTELATVVSYGLPIVIVLFNNGSLGMVRQWQGMYYGGRYSNSELNRKTDFVKLAEAFGLSACRVATAEEFKTAFENAINGDKPYLIDAVIDIEEKVLPINTEDKKEV